MTTKKPPQLETQLKELDNVIQSLEQGELTLEKSLENFEQGVKLIKNCQTILTKAEQKVQVLLNEETLAPYEDEAE
jgi:exodeoxyribonuclease VII small subunit